MNTRARVTALPVLPLTLENVSYRVGEQVLLRQISFCFNEGGPTMIVGPNGAGKTLLLRICHGLIQPTKGAVRWANPAQAQVAGTQSMVFQRPVLLRRSVASNVEFAMHTAAIPRSERRDRLNEALELAGLVELTHRPARLLSGGEQQRLSLARAWAIRPQVLFLDEPTAHLDPSTTGKIEQMIRSIATAGTRIIMVTHHFDQARRLGDDMIFMHHGRLIESAPGEQFFSSPGSEELIAFLEGRLLW